MKEDRGRIMTGLFLFILFITLAFSFPERNTGYEKKENEFMQYVKDKEIKRDITEIKTVKEAEILEEVVKPEEELSPIELMYKERTGETVKQFGYEIFKKKILTLPVPVGDEYILGPGDELLIYFWGDPVDILGLESFYSIQIDREGKIFIPSIGVIHVWGKTLGDFKKELVNRLSQKFRRFSVDVSVGKLRTFPVYVSGFVKEPGIVLATGVNTVLDVLTSAGGITKSGSLRNIVLRRYEGGRIKEIKIDLYDFLVFGEPIDIRVKDGDTIYVPPVGKTVGIIGAVKRPAIYELKDEETLNEILNLAGGVLPSAYSPVVRILRYEEDTLKAYEISLNEGIEIADGDIIKVESVYPAFVKGEVIVEGYVAYPGRYSLIKNPTLADLLPKVGILPDTNLEYGEVVRKDGTILTFKVRDIFEKRKNIKLKDGDTIKFFKKWEYEPIEISGDIENPRTIPYYEGITLKEALRGSKYKYSVEDLKVIVFRKEEQIKFVDKFIDKEEIYTLEAFEQFPLRIMDLQTFNRFLSDFTYTELLKLKRVLEKRREDLLNLLNTEKILRKEKKGENSLNLTTSDTLIKEYLDINLKLLTVNQRIEEYRRKGIFFVGYLYDILIKGTKDITLRPGDKILIKKKLPEEKVKTVTILGEVRKPGVYRLEEGMTLYDLIVKAGGYTERAYPKGLIFIRESAKRLQEEHLRIALTALEEAVIKGEEGISLAGATAEERIALEITLRKQRELLNLIKQRAKIGLGRIALDVPETLEELKDSPANIPLEDGDYIYVPSRPNYVLVLGDVYNQIAVPYEEGKPLSYYLQAVGGPGKTADLENIYVIKANGRVISRRNYDRFLTFRWEDGKLYFGTDFMSMPLEEGDTIVVPSELKVPVMWRPLIRDVVQIIFQAISTAVLAQRL